MLGFSLSESVAGRNDWRQMEAGFQEQFGLHQNRIAGVEATLSLMRSKVSVC